MCVRDIRDTHLAQLKCGYGAGSYKTYFRPLRQTPLPYPLAQGETVVQSVSLLVSDDASRSSNAATIDAPSVSVNLGGVIPGAASLPKIGVGIPPAHAAAMAKAMRASAGNDTGASEGIFRVTFTSSSEAFVCDRRQFAYESTILVVHTRRTWCQERGRPDKAAAGVRGDQVIRRDGTSTIRDCARGEQSVNLT